MSAPTDGAENAAEEPRDLSPEEKERGMHYVLHAAALGVLFFYATSGSILTLFAKRIGASNTQIGGLLSLFWLFSVLQIFIAQLIERRGKKQFIIGGWLVGGAVALGYLLVPWVYRTYGSRAAVYSLMAAIVPLAVARQVAGVGWMPLLNDVVPSEVRGRFFGKMRTVWQGVTILFIAAVSLFFAGSESAPFWRYQVVFAIGIIASFARIWAVRRIPELPPAAKGDVLPVWRSLAKPFSDSIYVRFITFSVLITMALAFVDSYMVVYLKSSHLAYNDSQALFLSTVVFFIGSTVSLLLWGVLADKVGSKPLLIITTLCIGAVRFLWLATTGPKVGPFVITAIYFLNGVFSAGFGIANTKYLFAISPRHFGKTTYITMAAVLTTLVAAVMMPLGGFMIDGLAVFTDVLERYGLDEYRLPFVVSGILTIFSAAVLIGLRERHTVPTREVIGALFGRPLRTGYNVYLWNRSLPEERRISVTRNLGDLKSVIGEPELIAALDDPSFQVRREAAEALGRMKSDRAVKPLVDKLLDPYSFIRVAAAAALGQIGSSRALEALEKVLRDSNPELRMQAALALGKIGRVECVPVVREAMSREGDRVVWCLMATALGMLDDEKVAAEVVQRIDPETPDPLRRQLLIAASNSIGEDNDLYRHLHAGQEGFSHSCRDIISRMQVSLRKYAGDGNFCDPEQYLDVDAPILDGDYSGLAYAAYECACNIYGPGSYPRRSPAGDVLAVIVSKTPPLRWDTALLALVCLEVLVRQYPDWGPQG